MPLGQFGHSPMFKQSFCALMGHFAVGHPNAKKAIGFKQFSNWDVAQLVRKSVIRREHFVP
jgi:hypothetical protein